MNKWLSWEIQLSHFSPSFLLLFHPKDTTSIFLGSILKITIDLKNVRTSVEMLDKVILVLGKLGSDPSWIFTDPDLIPIQSLYLYMFVFHIKCYVCNFLLKSPTIARL